MIGDRGKFIVQALNLPKELAIKHETRLACLIMLNSHSLVHERRMKPECRALLGQSADEMWARYYHVFLDNNASERYTFFYDPLI